jgi:hypothetical protein
MPHGDEFDADGIIERIEDWHRRTPIDTEDVLHTCLFEAFD